MDYADWTDPDFDGEHVTVKNVDDSDLEIVGATTGLLPAGDTARVPKTEQVEAMLESGALKPGRKPKAPDVVVLSEGYSINSTPIPEDAIPNLLEKTATDIDIKS